MTDRNISSLVSLSQNSTFRKSLGDLVCAIAVYLKKYKHDKDPLIIKRMAALKLVQKKAEFVLAEIDRLDLTSKNDPVSQRILQLIAK